MDLLDAIEITKTEKKDYQFFVEFSEREDKYSPEVYFIDGAHIDFIRSDTEIEILFEFDFNYFYKKIKTDNIPTREDFDENENPLLFFQKSVEKLKEYVFKKSKNEREEIFILTPQRALDFVLNGETVKDSEDGYLFRYPSKDELEHGYCSSSEIIRWRKNDTTFITIPELACYSEFIGADVKFRIIK